MARAVLEARAALTIRMAPSQVVTRADTMLRMVSQGFRDMGEADEDRVLLGFLGVVVFGRSMTLVMQNLRTYDREAFERWHEPWQEEMKGDPLMLYFYKLRTMVVHKDAPAIGSVLAATGKSAPPIGSITVDDLPPPDGHLGEPIDDTSMGNLCRLYLAYPERMFESFHQVAFAVQDRPIAAEGL